MIILDTNVVSELMLPDPSPNVVDRVAGRPINHADCQIAAIARCRGSSVATRNVGDFEGTRIEVINP